MEALQLSTKEEVMKDHGDRLLGCLWSSSGKLPRKRTFHRQKNTMLHFWESSERPSSRKEEEKYREARACCKTTHLHKSRVAVAKAIYYGFELLPHPPYPSNLAPSDFHLFPHMKKKLRGRVFGSDEETKKAVIDVLEGLPTDLLEIDS